MEIDKKEQVRKMNKKGASDSFRNLLIGFLLFSVFAILIITAIGEIGMNYDVSTEKLEQATAGALNKTQIEQDLNSSPDTTENYRERFESGEVNDVDDVSGIFSVIGDTISIIVLPFTLLANILSVTFHIPKIFTYTILSIINILLLLGIWRVLRVGD